MKAHTVRIWSVVHTWTSLICTVFMLLLCLTGLPLIFHHEIDELLGYSHEVVPPAGAKKLPVDVIAAGALKNQPGKVLQYIAWERDEPDKVVAYTNAAPDAPPNDAVLTAFNAYTAEPMGLVGGGPMLIVLRLHVDMFAGLPGKLFLGAMGLLLVVAVISGVVLYWPFTRRLEFGAIRRTSTRRVKWFDFHNLLGVTTVVWVLIVGGTGVINTWAELMLDRWKATELAAMAAPYAGKGAPRSLGSLDLLVANAAQAAPGMSVAFIAFPGTPFSSSHHYAAFMRGDTALTSRLLRPILFDGETSRVTDTHDLPFYLKALFVSQPLHFGDYGGMPLKIIWAVLDVLAIVVLGSGLYLWIARLRRTPSPARKPAAKKSRMPSAEATLKRVFRAPVMIAVISLSGLLAALIGGASWYPFAWIATGLVPAICLFYWGRSRAG